MVQLYPTPLQTPSGVVAKPVDSTRLLLLGDGTPSSRRITEMLMQEGRTVFQTDGLKDTLEALTSIEAGVLLISQGHFRELTGDWVLQVKRTAPDISILLCMQTMCGKEDLVKYYDWGIADVIPSEMESRIVQNKISMHETLYRQRDELRKMNERLQCANKQLEEYVYIVSHDLKAPLRGLSSLAQFIEDELSEQMTTEVSELLSMMKSRTDRMQQMIDGILHYSRMASNRVDREPVDIKSLINNIIDLICPPSNVRIEYPDQLPVVEMEKIKIHEVLQNLILNGIKHNDKSDIHIQIQFRDTGGWLEFAVKDNGKGIKSEHQEKVFGLFQTLLPKDKSEGTGLGLTIVKKIVEQQEGKVSVESEFGKGTTFRFTWKK